MIARTLLFCGLLLSGLAFLFVMARLGRPIDPDVGGYKDTWGTPDKLWHGLAGYALTLSGYTLAVHPIFGPLTVALVGVGFEYTQEYRSKKDAIAVSLGVLLAVTVRYLGLLLPW